MAVRWSRINRGYAWHAVRDDEYRSLCGMMTFAPYGARHDYPPTPFQACRRCLRLVVGHAVPKDFKGRAMDAIRVAQQKEPKGE